MTRTVLSVIVCALELVLTVPALSSAQSFQGGLRAEVRDAQGVIPGVTVALVNPATHATRETVTYESGEYSFPALDPTRYAIHVEVSGFRPYENANVQVGTQQFLSLDIVLAVGTVEESITVSGTAPLIDTSNASQGGTLTSADFKELPSEGRSVFTMATLQPTVVASGGSTARLSVERQHSDLRRPGRLGELQRGLSAGRLAGESSPDDQLRIEAGI